MEPWKPLLIGGVLRCCIKTLNNHHEKDGSQEEGFVLPCEVCSNSLIVKDGFWRWNRPEDSWK